MTDVKPLVLLVEDEAPMRKFIRASLTSHDYRILEAERAGLVTSLVTSHNPDIILMDLGLPDGDGVELTKELCEWNSTPIIVISARGREEDKVAALDAGAVDYLTKPFGVNELLARMRVVLRHRKGVMASLPTTSVLEFGQLRIDLSKRTVTLDGKELHLTPTEYRLLILFAQNAGKLLTHRQILTEVWGPAYVHQTQNVRVHLAELRRKIESDPSRPKLIVTEPGVGYRLREHT
jgi:two-component system KDP operon response regulator KdpE